MIEIGNLYSRSLQFIAQIWMWWLDEIKTVVPPELRTRVFGLGSPTPELIVTRNHIEILNRASGQSAKISTDDRQGLASALAALHSKHRRDGNTEVSVRVLLPEEDCLKRVLNLPEAAEADTENILRLDLQRATPFQASEIYSAHRINPKNEPDGQIEVEQFIVKRSFVDLLIAPLTELGARVEAICIVRSLNPFQAVSGNLLAQHQEPASLSKPAQWSLLMAGVTVMASALFVTSVLHHQSLTLEMFGQQIAALKAEAREIQTRQSKSETARLNAEDLVRNKQEAITVTETLEELTRLLPDEAWLTKLIVSGGKLQLVGFASAADQILPMIEDSRLFSSPTFSAPVRLDAKTQKERFRISFELNDGGKPIE